MPLDPAISNLANAPNPPAGSRALRVLALCTACATFPLIFMGGLVTSHKAGLAVPDWPNSFGYNMFLFPPGQWVGGIFYEHTHRLAGTVVGMLSIALAAVAWFKEPRKGVRILAYCVLAGVVFQGVLGGLRVVWKDLDLAIVHACFAQAFFCLTAAMCVVTSRWWQSAGAGDPRRPRTLSRLAILCVGAIYLQLIIGAVMRHNGAGLAIPDLPLAYGRLLPPTTQAQLDQANWDRLYQSLEPVTFMQVWIHFAHRIGAVVVSLLLLSLITLAAVRHRHQNRLLRPALLLLALLAAQITLGVLTVLLKKPADIASAHVAVGATTLFTTFILALRAARFERLPRPIAPAPASVRGGRPLSRKAVAA